VDSRLYKISFRYSRTFRRAIFFWIISYCILRSMIHLPAGHWTLRSHIIRTCVPRLAVSHLVVVSARPLNKRVSALICVTSMHEQPMFHCLHPSTFAQVVKYKVYADCVTFVSKFIKIANFTLPYFNTCKKSSKFVIFT